MSTRLQGQGHPAEGPHNPLFPPKGHHLVGRRQQKQGTGGARVITVLLLLREQGETASGSDHGPDPGGFASPGLTVALALSYAAINLQDASDQELALFLINKEAGSGGHANHPGLQRQGSQRIRGFGDPGEGLPTPGPEIQRFRKKV